MENNYKKIFAILSKEQKCKDFCFYINEKLAKERYDLCKDHWGDHLHWFLNYQMVGDVSYSYRMNTLGEIVSIIIENIFYLRDHKELATRQLLSISVTYNNYTGIINDEIEEYISELITNNIKNIK